MHSASERWLGGELPSPSALDRMEAYFPRPSMPFRGVPQMDALAPTFSPFDHSVDAISFWDLNDGLLQIASATACFGHTSEWDTWFRYLLPRVLRHGDRDDIPLESLVSAFFLVFWAVIPEDYPGMRDDVLRTFPQAVLLHDLRISARGSELVLAALAAYTQPSSTQLVTSAALFWGLQFLTPGEMTWWVQMVTGHPAITRRAKLLHWLDRAYPLLLLPRVDPVGLDGEYFDLGWEGSESLVMVGEIQQRAFRFNDPAQFLPQENRVAFLAQLDQQLCRRFDNWCAPIEQALSGERDVRPIIERVKEKYFR